MNHLVRLRLFDVLPLLTLIYLCCGCNGPAPKVENPTVTNVGPTTARLGGTVLPEVEGGERGVVFSRLVDDDYPDYYDAFSEDSVVFKVIDEDLWDGTFTVDVTGLEPNTEYVFRAWSVNEKGAGHSEPLTFTTAPGVAGGETFEVDGSEVRALAVQPDGKVLVGGRFTSIAGEEALNLARLKPDGSLDPTFIAEIDQPNYGGRVNAIAVQPDGKIIVGGYFDHINGVGSATVNVSIARLNPDGSRDASFVATTNYGSVRCLAVQPDGSILVGGILDGVNGVARFPFLARLFDDGTIDPSFNPGGPTVIGPNQWVDSILVQEDGKIVIAGLFSAYNGVPCDKLARLTPNGQLDGSFDTDATAYSLAQQPDGKILFGGNRSPHGNGLFRIDGNTGALDPTFATSIGTGALTNDSIDTIAVQADGKILIGGFFSQVGGTPRTRIARVNADGTLDPSFEAALDGYVVGVALGSDGAVFACSHLGVYTENAKMLGVFNNDPASSTLTGFSSVNWVRGGGAPEVSAVTFEVSMNGGSTWTDLGAVDTIPGGGGWWIENPSLPGNGLLRARGRTTGGSYGGSSGIVEQIEDFPIPGVSQPSLTNPTHDDVDSDYALLGGEITNVGASPITERGVLYSRASDNDRPALNAFGVNKEAVDDAGGGPITTGAFTVDVFDLIGGVTYRYRAYAINSAGRISYSGIGTFTTIGAPTVISPTVTGITDTGATLGGNVFSSGGNDVTERGIILVADSVIDGERLADDNTDYETLIDLNITGDGTGVFTIPVAGLAPATNYVFSAYAVNSEGTVYSEEEYFTTTGASEPESGEDELLPGLSGPVEESAPAGQIDSGFVPGAIDGLVQAVAVLPGGAGDILIAGEFAVIQGEAHRSIARLDEGGDIITSFDADTNGVINSVAVEADGDIVIGGLFSSVNGSTRNGIAKLDAQGDTISPTEFDPGAGADKIVYSVALQPDGKILLGGLFENVRGTARPRLARLNANGTLDTAFNPIADDAVYSIAVQPDGKILVAGQFQNIAGNAANRIARLNADGSFDNSFDAGAGANDRITAITLQSDGKVLLGGYFTDFAGNSGLNRIARLDSFGVVDPAFNPGTGANEKVLTLSVQTDGKILVGGQFTSFNGSTRNRIVRLMPTGGLDPNFDAGNGADGEVSAVALQSDGSILIGGNFANFDNTARPYLLRFGNDAAVEQLTVVDGTRLEWTRGGAGPAVKPLGFELSTDLGTSWTPLGGGVPVGAGFSLSGQDLPLNGTVRVLGQTVGGFLGGSAGLVEEIVVFDHGAIVTGLRAKLAVANANVAKIQKQIKAAKKQKNKSKLKKLNASLKTAMAQIPKINADLAKY